MLTKKSKKDVAESFVQPHGFDFDLKESFKKLSTSQFGGHPSRGFCELVQNAIDSYGEQLPMQKRDIDLTFTNNSITVRDYGEGMSRERLALITTLGGTDKTGSVSKIGQFGIGFFAIFNPALNTRKVEIRTVCEQKMVDLSFEIDPAVPLDLPSISSSVVHGGKGTCGTSITVTFGSKENVTECLNAARHFLKYLPCNATINKEPFTESVWHDATRENTVVFKDADVHGFVRLVEFGTYTTVLSRYERVLHLSLGSLVSECTNSWGDLRDYRIQNFPYIPAVQTVVNSNSLKVTVSRDSISMDKSFHRMIISMRAAHRELLLLLLDSDNSNELVIANQFTHASLIRDYLNQKLGYASDNGYKLAEHLALAKVYRISGREELVSLKDIFEERTSSKPVYFSPSGNFVNWLGGAFDHDFVVVPLSENCTFYVDGFYSFLFADVFGDTVNLDTIQNDRNKLASLVKRGLVDAALLSPVCKHISRRKLSENEKLFLKEVNDLISEPSIINSISQSLCMNIDSIQAGFFEISNQTLTIATGLFEENGKVFDNIRSNDQQQIRKSGVLKLGLMRTHPVVKHLINNNDPDRVYYAMVFLAHELVRCQQRLAPYSAYKRWVMSALMKNMRRAMINLMLEQMPAEQDEVQASEVSMVDG